MRILVTGGAGFIGSHVCERLVRDGHEVSVVDNLSDFYAEEIKKANLDAVRQAGPFRWHFGSICDARLVDGVFQEDRPEAVIHLAARAGVRPSIERPLCYEHTNVRGTMVMLEACRRFGVRKFIFASSSSVYGVSRRVPFREDDPLLLPISPYAATKLAGEQLCHTYSHLWPFNIVCLRFFTVYGPRQRPDLAIRKFTEGILEGRAIPVFGNGSSSRDYTYIDDIVDGVLGALQYDCPFDIINLGGCSPVRLDDLIRTIERVLGKRATIERLGGQAGDVPVTWADISKARRLLCYEPTTSLEEGIRRFVDWLDGQKSSQPANLFAD